MSSWDRRRTPRLLLLVSATCISLVLALWVVQQLLLPLVVWTLPQLEGPLYDGGLYGPYRVQTYRSFNLTSPLMSVVKWDESCGDGYVFLDPNGPSVNHQGPLIVDAHGNLVWTSEKYKTTTTSRLQTFNGTEYLTFWSGRKDKTTGVGQYYMLDNTYNVVHTVNAVGEDLHGDLHEFEITHEGTALVAFYNTTQMDLRRLGQFRSKNGWVRDSGFQEISIATGELLFEWRASDHFSAEETFMSNPLGGYTKGSPYDFFHLNSVSKDSKGNYLISSRHYHAIYYLNGTTGHVIWGLGGHNTDFVDLSSGEASSFSWQHHARWLDESSGILSLFDNSYAWPHSNAPYSTARIIQLDFTNSTATLLHSFSSQNHIASSSQGSVQRFTAQDAKQHYFIGWGSSAAFSEFTTSGTLLCETHFSPSIAFYWERIKSYRAFKALKWDATPYWNPSAIHTGEAVYVSWNGATTVHTWTLEGLLPSGRWEAITSQQKRTFETALRLHTPTTHLRYRVAAIDHHGATIRYTAEFDAEENKVNRFAVWCGCCLLLLALGGAVWWGLGNNKTELLNKWRPWQRRLRCKRKLEYRRLERDERVGGDYDFDESKGA